MKLKKGIVKVFVVLMLMFFINSCCANNVHALLATDPTLGRFANTI